MPLFHDILSYTQPRIPTDITIILIEKIKPPIPNNGSRPKKDPKANIIREMALMVGQIFLARSKDEYAKR